MRLLVRQDQGRAVDLGHLPGAARDPHRGGADRENTDFARRLEEAGIVFIGPKHQSIAAMGDKIASKKLANAAKVNCIPGHNEAIATPDR